MSLIWWKKPFLQRHLLTLHNHNHAMLNDTIHSSVRIKCAENRFHFDVWTNSSTRYRVMLLRCAFSHGKCIQICLDCWKHYFSLKRKSNYLNRNSSQRFIFSGFNEEIGINSIGKQKQLPVFTSIEAVWNAVSQLCSKKFRAFNCRHSLVVLDILRLFVSVPTKGFGNRTQCFTELNITWNGLYRLKIMNKNVFLIGLFQFNFRFAWCCCVCYVQSKTIRRIKNPNLVGTTHSQHLYFHSPFILLCQCSPFIASITSWCYQSRTDIFRQSKRLDQIPHWTRNCQSNFVMILYSWLKYVIRTYITTFFSIELLLLFRYSIMENMSSKIELIISSICYFILIFIIRILFHVQIIYEWNQPIKLWIIVV